jgi:hypothetical protein
MDQGWFMCYLLFLGWWMAGLVAYEVYGQLFKSNKNDTETDQDFIDDSINKKIPYEEAQKCLAFYERIDQIKCPHCEKEAKELDWGEFKSSSSTWNNLAGRAGYYCYCKECDYPVKEFITVMN